MASPKMTVSQLVLCALVGLAVIDAKPPSKIVGGESAYDGEFPYQVSLTQSDSHVCGGSIIDSTHILTAAHCIENVQTAIYYMAVTVGTKDIGTGQGLSYPIRDVVIHPQYFGNEDASWQNDLAIITLAVAIEFNSRTRPIALPSSDVFGNEQVTASGWGDTFYPNGRTPVGLKKLKMTIIPNSRCYVPGIGGILPTHICVSAGTGSGVCTGDSGGPLVKDGTLVGVASFVIPCGLGYPDVFTRVYSYVSWIRSITGRP